MSESQLQCTEERVTFEREGLALSGVLSYPATGEPERAVLLCAPHPNFAGDMNNNVIVALAQGLAAQAVVLRFDYHGIGASQINLPTGVSVFDYWMDVEETHDYSAAARDAAAAADFLSDATGGLELDVTGYSFGAATGLHVGLADPRIKRMVGIAPPLARVDFGFLEACPKPCLLLAGGHDFVCSAAELTSLAAQAGARVQMEILPEDDHFFRGREAEVVERAQAFLVL